MPSLPLTAKEAEATLLTLLERANSTHSAIVSSTTLSAEQKAEKSVWVLALIKDLEDTVTTLQETPGGANAG